MPHESVASRSPVAGDRIAIPVRLAYGLGVLVDGLFGAASAIAIWAVVRRGLNLEISLPPP